MALIEGDGGRGEKVRYIIKKKIEIESVLSLEQL